MRSSNRLLLLLPLRPAATRTRPLWHPALAPMPSPRSFQTPTALASLTMPEPMPAVAGEAVAVEEAAAPGARETGNARILAATNTSTSGTLSRTLSRTHQPIRANTGPSRERMGRRGRNNEWEDHKRRKVNGDGAEGDDAAAARDRPSYMSIPFSETEIAAEERRPKRKVAVMIGYAGTGYRGLQINHREKTIEGELFGAFVAARAISKVNADDPKKSSLVRCARTDKGVHAAGNVLSLKLIIEDEDVVQKINAALPPQIRVWGIQRTNNSFSCYQTCDSRWYEYLMPSYCLLPPHPESFMGKKILEAVEEQGIEEEYSQRLGALRNFWDEVEKNEIQPILDGLDHEVREKVIQRRHLASSSAPPQPNGEAEPEPQVAAETQASAAEGVMTVPDSTATPSGVPSALAGGPEDPATTPMETSTDGAAPGPRATEDGAPEPKEQDPVDAALKQIKTAYVAAKRRYRVTPDRIERLQEALGQYVGTRNYHNYTIQKSSTDPSAKRNIKSFVVNPQPIQINDTEWLSLKVHGQSFMMHQIRKMVGMAVLVTRCGTDMSRIQESYGPTRISIPKAPSLGLLLERPVFENYNKRAEGNYERPAIDFANYEKEIQAFKDAHIYQHIFALEEKENS